MNSQKNFGSLLKKEIIVADGKTVMMFTFTGLQIQNQGILFRLNCSHAHLQIEEGIISIYIDDDISSLSAILLNDDYYNFMMEGRRIVDEICVLDAAYLIPFKMFAWNDLMDKKNRGEHVNERDLKKHKYDVFRLLEIVPNDTAITVSGSVAENISKFLEKIVPEPVALAQIGLSIEKEQAIEMLKQIYIS